MPQFQNFFAFNERAMSRLALFVQARPEALIVCYFFVQTVALSILVPGAAFDDGEQITYLGDFAWGYGGSQPPLYTWILNSLSKVFGLSMPVLFGLRFSLLAIAVIGVYRAILELSNDKAAAVAAAIGMFLLPSFGWDSQRVLTHSVLMTAGAALFLLAFVRHLKTGSRISALAMGAAAAVVFLSKYNAPIFIIALFAAAICFPNYRLRLLTKRAALGVAVFLLLCAPHVLWMMTNLEYVLARSAVFAIANENSWIETRLIGMGNLIEAAFVLLAMLAATAILALIFSNPGSDPPVASRQDAQFLGLTIIFGMLIIAAVMLASGGTSIRYRWLLPVLFAAPAATAVYASAVGGRRIVLYSITSWGLLIALGIMPALWINQVYGTVNVPPFAQYDFKNAVKDLNLSQAKVIVSDFPLLAGNLKLQSHQVTALHPETPSPDALKLRPLVIAWLGGGVGSGLPPVLKEMFDRQNISIETLPIEIARVKHLSRPENLLSISFITLR